MKIVNNAKLQESLLECNKQEKTIQEEVIKEDAEENEVKEIGGTTIVTDEKDISGKSKDPEIALVVENALTKQLDEALAVALEAKEDGDDYNANVLVKGLPGSSKTKTVEGWARAHGCNLFYLDAKNPDIQLLISGGAYTYKDTDPDTGKEVTKMGAAYSDALAPLEKPRSILFLDELNRQVREGLRGSLLSLIAGHYVQGNGEDGKKHFDNMLFTVACINPRTPGDMGIVDLGDAERRRFFYKVQFDSTVDTTVAYLTAYYNKKLEELSKEADKTSAKYMRKLRKYVLGQHLGLFIAKHEDFRYTTFDDISSRDWEKGTGEYARAQKLRAILCQSTLTELVANCKGNPEVALNWIANEKDNLEGLNDKSAQMLEDIIKEYVPPIFEAEVAKKQSELGITLLDDLEMPAEEPARDEKAAGTDTGAASSTGAGSSSSGYEEDDEDWDADAEAEKEMEAEEADLNKKVDDFFDM